MTERGLPIVDGAPACPFVAFEDDRDGRALAPDHRHRCFAEPRPAPRALAHQEAYCLSSAFPVCPTFQDWARREAAAARPEATDGRGSREEPPVSRPMPPREREPRHAPTTDTPPPIPPRRHQPRDWAAPPPWAGDEDAEAGASLAAGAAAAAGAAGFATDAEPPSFLSGRGRDEDAGRPAREERGWGDASRGLAGSAADRLASGAGDDEDFEAPPPRPVRSYAPPPDDLDEDEEDEEDEHPGSRAGDAWPARSSRAAPVPPRRVPDRAEGRRSAAAPPSRDHVRRRREEEAAELFGPAWERPRRFEAYPSLRTRVGLPSFSGLWVGIAALVLAAVVLFFVGPMLLGLGGKSPDTGVASPTASAASSVEPSPTLPPAPTPQLYIVAKGDTISKIAVKFGVTVDELMAANKQIKNPNKINVGDELTIPVPQASSVPDQVEGSTAP